MEAREMHLNLVLWTLSRILAHFLFLKDLRVGGDECEYALLGHSFGSLIVWLLLIKLRQARFRMPKHVFIGSKRAPQFHEPFGDAFFRDAPYPEQEAFYLEHHGAALPDRFRQDKALLQMVVQSFGVDMRVNNSFWMDQLDEEERKPFDIPCTIFWGEKDLVVRRDAIEGWNDLFVDPKWIIYPDMAHMLVGPAEKQKEIMAEIAKVIGKE